MTEATLRVTKWKFHNQELPHELFLTTREKTIIRNTSANNKATDIKISLAKFSKII